MRKASFDSEDSSWNTWGRCQNRFQMAWVGLWKPSQVKEHAWMTFLVWTYHLSEFRQLGKRRGSYIDYWNGRKRTDIRPILWDRPSSLQKFEQANRRELQCNTHNFHTCFVLMRTSLVSIRRWSCCIYYTYCWYS
jgi:hypothetical protein